MAKRSTQRRSRRSRRSRRTRRRRSFRSSVSSPTHAEFFKNRTPQRLLWTPIFRHYGFVDQEFAKEAIANTNSQEDFHEYMSRRYEPLPGIPHLMPASFIEQLQKYDNANAVRGPPGEFNSVTVKEALPKTARSRRDAMSGGARPQFVQDPESVMDLDPEQRQWSATGAETRPFPMAGPPYIDTRFLSYTT